MSLLPFEQRVRSYGTIYNFRDFGGYRAAGGKAVRSGRLFRSAHLNSLSDADLADIAALELGLVVDLRHKPERARQPSRQLSEATITFTYPDPKHREGESVAPHEAFTKEKLHTPADAHGYMMGSYAARPNDDGFQKIFGDTLRHMAENGAQGDDGILVHCAAGKDRTGTLCALIQGVLGVSEEDILADYMLTLEAVNIDEILIPASKMFAQKYGRDFDPEALRPMFGVTPEFLEASLNNMNGIERYAVEDLGLTEAQLSALRAVYLEG